ncbi:sel1 repeat family protein [Streptomyces sp. ME02-6991-2A]|uniref:sel1 repeat family protein n=1 Tax=Streptomyces TaxID=1883 RepID=UPI0029B218B6|nr:sel1 repeat family protein [Streptomyces sp. ME02-6991-2A]MDX3378175.1 sel1 repeat family protein [Streptomyces sp. ME02-6991-2A]
MGVAEEREAPNDTAVGVGNSVSGGAFHAPVVQAGSVSGGVHTYYAQPAHSPLPPVSEWQELDTADPVALGVRRTRCLPGESLLPPYVGRDCDAELDDRVVEAARSGGLVVVTGAPLSGKSRTVWCALFTNLPMTTRIFAPQPGTDLRGLPAVLRGRGEAGCLLWLDDLEGHLGEHGLTPTLLAELVRLRVPVLATMDDEAYDARRFGPSARAGVLSGAEPVELQREWSASEQRRLGDLLAVPRLRAAALVRGGHTVPEYLALGPELMEEWRRARRAGAHPRGHLIVRAAIDLGRCGLRRAYVSRDVLRRAQALYPQELGTARSESFEDGLAWAAGIRHGVTGLLVPGDVPDTWAAFGSLVADVDERVDSPPVPLRMWSLALLEASDQQNRNVVWATAQRLLEPRGTGEPEVAAWLGEIYTVFGQRGMAKQWFRTAADAGHTEAAAALGELLASLDEPAEAIPYLEQAAEAGIVRSQYLLGILLAERAQDWLTRAAEAGYPAAADALPPLRKVTATPPDTVKE